jgi:hypothetical protein
LVVTLVRGRVCEYVFGKRTALLKVAAIKAAQTEDSAS